MYFGAASIAGGSFCLWQYNAGRRQLLQANLNYILLGAVLGFQAVILNYLIQVGLIIDAGLPGMFDWEMASLLLGTQLGDVTFYRLAGFVLAMISSLLLLRKVNQIAQPPDQNFYRVLILVHAFALVLLAISFRIAGHISVLSLTAQVAIVLHFAAFAIWIGSLYPLILETRSTEIETLRLTMQRFGNTALGVVLVLALAGVLMVWQLFDAPLDLFTSAYGLSILAKLLLVLAVLAVAGANRLYLVPRMVSESGVKKLRASIRYEMVLVTLILSLTSYLSTVIGPPGH